MAGECAEPCLRRRLVVGLGNPGERYRGTRHNLGFRVLEEVARRRRIDISRQECNALVGGDAELTLALPQTFMNRSGFAVRCLVERYGFAPDELLVVFDDVELPLGRLRLRIKGSPGGHRGMESVIHQLRTADVPRLRVGVAPEGGDPIGGEDLVAFVLAPFEAGEQALVAEVVQRAAVAVESWLEGGAQATMNRFNG